MKKIFLLIVCPTLLLFHFEISFAQTTTNKSFSFGSYGRVGAGFSPNITGNIGRSLNLNGMGSIGGRMEEADYVELLLRCILKQKITSDTTSSMCRQEWHFTAVKDN